ncbi:MAG: threonylcarbamoyl-AMP synthase [Acidobacteria bacterium]|nr:threonylcarbamoyl-AMP synthase [Acidobacteriota bacterium]
MEAPAARRQDTLPMMTAVVRVDRTHPEPAAILRAAACLRRGGLVAFPTETVYGLGAHALDPTAVRRLFDAKGRPSTDPLIVHVAGLDEAAALTTGMPAVAALLARQFWPGPLTLVMRRAAVVPAEVTAGLDTVAIRVPAHPVAQALLAAARLPVAAPSANLFSRPSPTRAEHVLDDLRGRIDLVLDAGPTPVGVESTVLDLTVDPPVVLRFGAIDLESLRRVVPRVQATPPAAAGGAMPSPGLLPQHYSPRTPLTLCRGDAASFAEVVSRTMAEGRRVGVLATSEDAAALGHTPTAVADLGSGHDARGVAARLYAALRELDAAQLDVILVRDFPRDDGLWRALRDRLRRAAARTM